MLGRVIRSRSLRGREDRRGCSEPHCLSAAGHTFRAGLPAPQRTRRCHPEPWLAAAHGLGSSAAAGVRSLAASPSTPACSARPQALLSSFWVQKPGIRFPEAFTHVGWHRVPPDPARARQTPIGAGTRKPGCKRTAGTGLAWGCPGTQSSPLHAGRQNTREAALGPLTRPRRWSAGSCAS